MPSDPEPSTGRKRVTLTAKEASSGLGQALCEIANDMLADGKLDASETAKLEKWLEASSGLDLPAINYIREEVRRFTADGKLLPWELGRLQLALERILPAPDRAIARAARKRAEAEFEALEAKDPEESLESDLQRHESMRASMGDESATKAQMKFIDDLGGSISINASKREASDLIGRLLAERDAIESAPIRPDLSQRSHADAKLRDAIAAHKIGPDATAVEVVLPARQPYEGRATRKQKDLIWSLGFKDENLIDSLGKWQASALIDQLRAKRSSGNGKYVLVGVVLLILFVIWRATTD